MSKSNSAKKGQSIDGAEEIIERFGGIRPMAKKMGVAVTTVQGWKKRDTIPAGRRAAVIETAIDHDIDLSDILPDAVEEAMPSFVTKPVSDDDDNVASFQNKDETSTGETEESDGSAGMVANENVQGLGGDDTEGEEDFYEAADVLKAQEKTEQSSGSSYVTSDIAAPKRDELDEKLKKEPKKSGGFGWILGGLLLAGATAGAVVLFGGDPVERERFLAQQSENGSFFSTLIPEDLDARIKDIQEKTGLTTENINNTIDRAKTMSEDVLGENGGTSSERAQKLNTYVKDLTGVDFVTYFGLENFQNMIGRLEETARGQTLINRSVAELSAVLQTVQDDPASFNIDEQLAMAQTHMPALSRTLSQVPPEDLKAAGMLLALTQFRKSLNRDRAAFNDDLQVLKILVGNTDPDLNAAIDRLAPYSEQGILTPNGLTNEFKTIAGEAVVASIKGEDVSFSERVKGRIGEVMQVEKDGELIVGNEAQLQVNKAENLLEQGEIGAAIKIIEQLDGPAAQVFQPWVKQAKATQSAQNLKGLISQAISGDAISKLGLDKGRFVRDKTGAVNVYTPR